MSPRLLAFVYFVGIEALCLLLLPGDWRGLAVVPIFGYFAAWVVLGTGGGAHADGAGMNLDAPNVAYTPASMALRDDQGAWVAELEQRGIVPGQEPVWQSDLDELPPWAAPEADRWTGHGANSGSADRPSAVVLPGVGGPQAYGHCPVDAATLAELGDRATGALEQPAALEVVLLPRPAGDGGAGAGALAPPPMTPTRGDVQEGAERVRANDSRPAPGADMTGFLSPRPHQEGGPVTSALAPVPTLAEHETREWMARQDAGVTAYLERQAFDLAAHAYRCVASLWGQR